MNYQSSALLIYSTKLLLILIFCVFIAFAGVTAPVGYLLAMGLIMPISISMRLHGLNEKGLVALPTKFSQWTMYVHGIPVEEKRSVLTNPCFVTKAHARTFFIRAYTCRLIVQIVFLIFLAGQIWEPLFSWMLLLAVIPAIWILVSAGITLLRLRDIYRNNWNIEHLVSPSQNEYFRAEFTSGMKKVSALEGVLSLN
ncbi:hypothetical protein [Dryocola clanedunensis]|uniref:hypothetical protein n=1 Tax=Cedecea sulfonylureivorans TaxID=3051154 RepID=UPI0019295ACC|nr:hypothetical protein [Cedecea sulfonylureivorans]